MEYSKRLEYIVIKDFESHLPISKIPVRYKKGGGNKVNLRPNGKMAKNWLEKGYIELANN